MAKFGAYTVAGTSYSIRNTLYRAIAAGPGYAAGDILQLTEQINSATLVATGVASWYNVDQDAVLAAAPVGANIEAIDGRRVVSGTETLIVSAASVGLATIPAGANFAEIHVWDADVALRVDGAAATTTTGYRQGNGATFELESANELTNLKAIRLGTVDARVDARLFVTYYTIYSFDEGV